MSDEFPIPRALPWILTAVLGLWAWLARFVFSRSIRSMDAMQDELRWFKEEIRDDLQDVKSAANRIDSRVSNLEGQLARMGGK